MRGRLAVLACVLTACGQEPQPDPLEFDHLDSRPQSSCADASYADGQVLALRYQSGIRLADGLADDYVWALETARTVYPELCDTRAAAHMEPFTLLVEPTLSRISDAWRHNRYHTGIADIDEVLDEVGISSISSFENFDLFRLNLDQPVNAQNLADALNVTGNVVAHANTIGQMEGQTTFIPFARDVEMQAGDGATTVVMHHDGYRCAVTVGHDGTVSEKVKL